ncbi:hypothetical protein GIB67_024279 [Kingdonia uniflora]|uniref:Uncharacterized protein n=1 Tax=Kingdonia uniflora TaxID=39325 RepID=A0A7J7LZX6_9MAGN|nr:hypothetical protein GIB67_024279 [Kingdonia uniflora]
MDDSKVIGTVTVGKPVVLYGRDMGLYAGIETGFFLWLWFRTLVRPDGKIDHYQMPSLDKQKGNMGIGDDINISYYNGIGAEVVDDGFFCYLSQIVYGLSIPLTFFQKGVMNALKSCPGQLNDNVFEMMKVCETLNKRWRDGEPNPKGAADISSLFDAVNREGTELNKVLGALGVRREKRLNSIAEKLSVAWKSTAEVLKLQKEKVLQRVQFKKEKALQKDQIEKDAAARKKEVEDEAKKAVDIVVASRNKLIQAFNFWGLSREDVDLALAGKYSEIIFPGNDASPAAEQSPAPPVADDTTKEEVVCLRGKVSKMEKPLSRARDSINRTQQLHNKLDYERRLHNSNFDNTFKELFELQCRYGKIKIERDEVLRKESDRFVLLQKSLKDKRFVDESDKLEYQRSLLSLTLYFKAEVDSEQGLKEAYLELLTERGIVPDPARVKFLVQEACNRHSIEAQRCSARAGVSIIWGGKGPLPDELDFYRGKEQ